MEAPIVSSAEMRAAEDAAFARGVEVEALMDQAGSGVARAVQQFFPRAGTCIVYAGKGHNGGDALVAADFLQRAGWRIELRLPFPEEECNELTRKKLQAVREHSAAVSPQSDRTIILDGLLGIGTKSFLQEPIRTTAREINRLRLEQDAFVFAVDLPSGFSDAGDIDPDCVVADFTVTIGFAKHSLISDGALDFVGRIEVVPLPDLRRDELPLVQGRAEAHPFGIAATAESLASLLPRRKFSAYKNQCGRIGVVAGSKGFVGAALMTAEGALRAGAGLVELFVPDDIYEIAAAAAPAEVMVKSTRGYRELAEQKIDVWAVGPGLGKSHAARIRDLIANAAQPMVLDADGLNILADGVEILKRCRSPRLLTPHPGEMERLFPFGKMSRAGIARNFTEQFPVTLLLKGSRTIVAQRDFPLSYNTTGNPGMATGGMGDVLTGVCAGLIGQQLSPYDAARLGAWLCGRAAEIAIFEHGASEQSLLPRDVLGHLGRAFHELLGRHGGRPSK